MYVSERDMRFGPRETLWGSRFVGNLLPDVGIYFATTKSLLSANFHLLLLHCVGFATRLIRMSWSGESLLRIGDGA